MRESPFTRGGGGGHATILASTGSRARTHDETSDEDKGFTSLSLTDGSSTHCNNVASCNGRPGVRTFASAECRDL